MSEESLLSLNQTLHKYKTQQPYLIHLTLINWLSGFESIHDIINEASKLHWHSYLTGWYIYFLNLKLNSKKCWTKLVMKCERKICVVRIHVSKHDEEDGVQTEEHNAKKLNKILIYLKLYTSLCCIFFIFHIFFTSLKINTWCKIVW